MACRSCVSCAPTPIPITSVWRACSTERFSAPLWMTWGNTPSVASCPRPCPAPTASQRPLTFAVMEWIRPSSRRCATATRIISRAWCRRCRSNSRASSAVRAIRIGGRTWRVIIEGLGHSPEHASLYCAEDRLLDIRRHGAAADFHQRVGLRDRTLRQSSSVVPRFAEEVRECDDDTLVLPSHGRPFRKLHVRLRQLDDHHQERLSTLLSASREKPLSGSASGRRWCSTTASSTPTS